MTTYDTIEIDVPEIPAKQEPAKADILARLVAAWQAALRKIEQRRTLHKLYQLDDHILADMGFDPEEIRTAHEGRISETDGSRFPRV
jgi:uncharacterized protein YjiS (DUF1127 family)